MISRRSPARRASGRSRRDQVGRKFRYCVNRVVEAEVAAQFFLISACRRFAEHHLHRIAGDQMDQDEHQRQCAEQGRQQEQMRWRR